ncbi:Hypothetical_protein [Hexamita inflata]|uniref:Hypothetical_protein n=1 Tax=Hexamita inflata TaxID=28002 RepID=A0AA86V4Y1_9EUKA|nr:Hypothetical protein HINF_LOCUS44568 [Hexamita inflata]
MGQTICLNQEYNSSQLQLDVVYLNNVLKCPNNSFAEDIQESKDMNYQLFLDNYTARKISKKSLDSYNSYYVQQLSQVITNESNQRTCMLDQIQLNIDEESSVQLIDDINDDLAVTI